jgi:hypothetical protein
MKSNGNDLIRNHIDEISVRRGVPKKEKENNNDRERQIHKVPHEKPSFGRSWTRNEAPPRVLDARFW